MSQVIKCEEKDPIMMKPADKEQAAKLLITWAKRNKIYHTFKLATYMMLEIRVKDGVPLSMMDVINNFYKSSKTEQDFVRTMNIWKGFINENGKTWRQVQMHRHPNEHVND